MKIINYKQLMAATAIALVSINAQAVLIDFESPGTPGLYDDIDYAIDGFIFNYPVRSIDMNADVWRRYGGAHSGSFAAINSSYQGAAITKADGGTFSFQSMWLKGGVDDLTNGPITGWLNRELVGSVSGVRNNSWTQLIGNFANIDTLLIQFGTSFFMDDILLDSPSVSPVPEPETYAMLLAGLGLMGGMARRRKQQLARA